MVTIVRSELETLDEDPLTEHEQIINELFGEVKRLKANKATPRISKIENDKAN